MKTFRIGVIFALLAGVLGGCATDKVIQTSNQVTAEVAQLQATAAQICGYVPTVSTAANLIAAISGFGPIVTTITSLAQDFCGAVTRPGATANGRRPVLHGVVLHYRRA